MWAKLLRREWPRSEAVIQAGLLTVVATLLLFSVPGESLQAQGLDEPLEWSAKRTPNGFPALTDRTYSLDALIQYALTYNDCDCA